MCSPYPPGPSLAINDPSLLKINPNLTTLVLKTNTHDEKQTKLNIAVFRNILATKAPNLFELYFTGTITGITDSKTIWNTTSAIPQLKLKKIGIKLQYNQEDLEPVLGYNEGFLCDLFTASLFLESLILTSDYESEKNESKVLRVLLEAKEGNLKHIKELQFEKVNKNTMDLIATQFKSPSLKSLIINNIEGLEVETFTRILENHKRTIENLKFLFDAGYQELVFPGSLEKLTKLEFGAYEASTPEPFFVGGTIQGDTFPNLVTLDLIDGIGHRSRQHSPPGTGLFDLEELFPKDGKSIPTLRSLSLPPLITVEGLRRAEILFPGAKKLTLGPQRSQVIGELWTMWKETLEILTISLNSETLIGHNEDECSYDSMITGLPDPFIEEIKENLKTDGQIPNVKITTLFPHRASIANLKRLSHVHFHNGPRLGAWSRWTPPSKFTDISFQLGFGQLKDLQVLVMFKGVVEVSVPVINEICKLRGLEQVNKHIGLSLVKFNYEARNLQTGFGLMMPFESLSLT